MICYKPKFLFGTKAETLERLKSLLMCSQIPAIYFFSVKDWETEQDIIMQKIRSHFNNINVIVRSSAFNEDSNITAMAGVHNSFPNINTDDYELLRNSIEKVILSYNKSYSSGNSLNQVLIQHMINNVSMSGVVFTQDMNTGAPYYVINYDDQTGRTDTVTAGGRHSNRTLLIYRENKEALRSERFKSLLDAVQEIEEIADSNALDIEFAVGMDNIVYIFQVRKITTQPNWNRGISLMVKDAILRVKSFINERLRHIEGIYGSRSILGQMPDWNPAEMIGMAPRPLSLSLYQFLITNRSWRVARSQMGYAEPKGAPLMVSLAGQPYIDARLSFHSFLPADVPSHIAHKLVDAYLKRLSEHRELHDRVEFDIAITALTFDFKDTLHERFKDVLTKDEEDTFRQTLFHLTNNLLTGHKASIDSELGKIERLEQERACLLKNSNSYELITVSALLEDCIMLGTIPFSILARHAFIAKSFLRSLIHLGVINETEALSFQRSVKTIAGDLVADIERLSSDEITQNEFMDMYGHLRPGTYDILSLRYDQREDLIKGLMQNPLKSHQIENFSFTKRQLQNIQALLKEDGYDITPDDLFLYMRKAIMAREYAKFVFSKNVSDALELIAVWGEKIGLSREELSYLSIDDILQSTLSAQGRTIEQHLRDKSIMGRENHMITLSLRFPHLIDKPEDASIIPLLISQPNFITQKTVRAPYIYIDGHDNRPLDMLGRIILIEGADPGFDWIFSCSIAGLVTKYGGANSHMAIRCAEFGLPAAIGCGEQIFDRILRSRSVELNCSEGRIVPLEW